MGNRVLTIAGKLLKSYCLMRVSEGGKARPGGGSLKPTSLVALSCFPLPLSLPGEGLAVFLVL